MIERVARFNDEPAGASLFDDSLDEAAIDAIIVAAGESAHFQGVNRDVARTILVGARKTERITRHKFNPNCPGLGDRNTLLELGILTNELPHQ